MSVKTEVVGEKRDIEDFLTLASWDGDVTDWKIVRTESSELTLYTLVVELGKTLIRRYELRREERRLPDEPKI